MTTSSHSRHKTDGGVQDQERRSPQGVKRGGRSVRGNHRLQGGGGNLQSAHTQAWQLFPSLPRKAADARQRVRSREEPLTDGAGRSGQEPRKPSWRRIRHKTLSLLRNERPRFNRKGRSIRKQIRLVADQVTRGEITSIEGFALFIRKDTFQERG